MEIKYAFDPDSEFQKKLEKVFRETGDLTIPLTQISRDWYKGNRSIFDRGRISSGRYQDLSEAYKIQKKRKWGFIYPVLFASGRLAESITVPGSPEAISIIINKSTLVLGSRTPYGIYHQSQTPRKKMPYRPFLFVGVEQIAPHDIQQNRLKNWYKIMDSYLDQKINQGLK